MQGDNWGWSVAGLDAGSVGTDVEIVSRTYAEMVVLKGASGFNQGFFYYITDRNYLIQAIETNRLSLSGQYYDTSLTEVSYIEYDLDNDLILRRRDHRGNDVSISNQYITSIGGSTTLIDEFLWGNNNVWGNTIVDSSVQLSVGGSDFNGTFANNTITNGSVLRLYDIVSANSHVFKDCVFQGGVLVVANDQSQTFDWQDVNVKSTTVTYNTTYGCQVYLSSFRDGTVQVNSDYIDWNCANVSVESGGFLIITNGGAVLRNVTTDDLQINSESTVTITASDRDVSFVGGLITTESIVTITSCSSIQDVTCVGDSDVSVSGSTTVLTDLNVEERSTLTISNRTAGTLSLIHVSGDSSVNIAGGSGTVNTWQVNGFATVTLTSNTTTKTNIIIEAWSVALDPSDAHNNIKLGLDYNSAFTPSWTSNVIEFYDATSKIVSDKIVLSAGTVDAYIGIIFLFNCSAVQASPTQVDGFTNSTVMEDKMIFLVQPSLGEYLEFVQDAQPVASGAIGLPANLTLYGQDGNLSGDTIKLQKSVNERFQQLDAWSIT